ncbi:MAG: 30S ribosomal protein S8 [Candidatus Marsarchaeota archaeon]|nr:30S ribosomal protein S8 [Candidatus Marsarchaeota archaeon]
MVDRLADAINTIKNNERIGREHCVLYSTKLIRSVLDILKSEHYIESYEEFDEGRAKKLKVYLSNRINDIGVVKPRFAVGNGEYQKYEERFIPSRDFGILIVSTPKGIMTNRDAREKNTGGRLLAYVY